jgi:pyruvate carboxylase subunit B
VLIFNGRSYAISIEGDMSLVDITLAGHQYTVEIENERERAARAAARSASKGGGEVKAVMPGMVIKILVSQGETVTKGTPLLVLEAMKMQNEITAPSDGVVSALHVSEGTAVSAGSRLVSLQAPDSD